MGCVNPNSAYAKAFDEECEFCGRDYRGSLKKCPHCGGANLDAIAREENNAFLSAINSRPRSIVLKQKHKEDDDISMPRV